MDGGEGGYVDEIILCVCWGGREKKKNQKKTRFSMRKFYFFSGIVRNVDYQA